MTSDWLQSGRRTDPDRLPAGSLNMHYTMWALQTDRRKEGRKEKDCASREVEKMDRSRAEGERRKSYRHHFNTLLCGQIQNN